MEEGVRADDDEEKANEAHHGFSWENFAKFGGEGCGDDAAEDEASDEGKIFQL